MKAALVGLMLLGCATAHVITDAERNQRRQMLGCVIAAYDLGILSTPIVCFCGTQVDGGLTQAELTEGVGLDGRKCE